MQQPPDHHLAQLNIGRIRYEVADPRMAGFVDNLAFVNALAERTPGFVWRYRDSSGNATNTRPFPGDPLMAVNMSVWENIESLEKYVWQTVHKRFYAQRHEWFARRRPTWAVSPPGRDSPIRAMPRRPEDLEDPLRSAGRRFRSSPRRRNMLRRLPRGPT